MTDHRHVAPATHDYVALVVGKVLQEVRRSRQMSRRDVLLLFPDDDRPSVQTLATWELGTRTISVWRLWQLCELLGGPSAYEVLQEAHRRVAGTDEVIDLVDIARLTDPVLRPLRQWAEARLRSGPSLPRSRRRVQLDLAMLTSLAQVCGLTEVDLVARLGRSFGRPEGNWRQMLNREGNTEPTALPANAARG